MKTKSHYDVLGIHKTATKRDIIVAYRREALKNHPDHHGNQQPNEAKIKAEYTERFRRVQEAFDVLSDQHKRFNYDRWELPEIERKQKQEAEEEARKGQEDAKKREEEQRQADEARKAEEQRKTEEAKKAEEVKKEQPKAEEPKKEDKPSEEQSGGFEYEQSEKEKLYTEWLKKKAQERQDELKNMRGWRANVPKDFGFKPRATPTPKPSKTTGTEENNYENEPAPDTKIPAPPSRVDQEKDKEMEDLSKWMSDGKYDVKDSNNNVVDHYTKSGNYLAYKPSGESLDPRAIDAMVDHALKVSKPPLKFTGGAEFMTAAMKACEKKGVQFENGNINPANFFRH